MAVVLDEWLTPEFVAKRYGWAVKTARKHMREEMRHRVRPLAVTPEALKEWEEENTFDPPEKKGQKPKAKAPRKKKQPDDGKFIIPRIRPA